MAGTDSLWSIVPSGTPTSLTAATESPTVTTIDTLDDITEQERAKAEAKRMRQMRRKRQAVKAGVGAIVSLVFASVGIFIFHRRLGSHSVAPLY